MTVMDNRRWACKAAVGVGITIVLMLAIGVYKVDQLYRTMAADLCGVTVNRMSPGPGGKNVLVTYEVSCGATTPFSTQVSLVPADARFSRDEYPPLFVVHGQHDLSVRWAEPGSIEIVVPSGEKIYRQEDSAGGIPITYK